MHVAPVMVRIRWGTCQVLLVKGREVITNKLLALSIHCRASIPTASVLLLLIHNYI